MARTRLFFDRNFNENGIKKKDDTTLFILWDGIISVPEVFNIKP
jgi:hypothetical protein